MAKIPDDQSKSILENLFQRCEQIKNEILSSTDPSDLWIHRQELLDQYEQLVLTDLDFALEKKIEHDLWTIVFKNDITHKQEQLKIQQQNANRRAEIQISLQLLYEYARGYYLKLLQDVVHSYKFSSSICRLTLPMLQKSSIEQRQCKEASMLYLIEHILVHVGDLNRYLNQIDLAKLFYRYAIETIPYLGQPYNQIAILHEMKNVQSSLSPSQNQLITTFYYVRSIAIKVPFPFAVANLEKLFQRLKDLPLTRYEQSNDWNENEFLCLFLQIIAMINLNENLSQIDSFIDIFRSALMKNFQMNYFLEILTIMIFTFHRSLGHFSRSTTKPSEQQFNAILQLVVTLIEQSFEVIQLPRSLMLIDEQQILPILYLSFAYLANVQRTKNDLFQYEIFKQKTNLWNFLAKLLRSFSVSARNLDQSKEEENSSIFVKFADYPLSEERTLECFSPLNDHFKVYQFKKYLNDDERLSEKDERQLRKFRFVSIVRNLCQKKIFDYLLSYIKDDLIYFESSVGPVQQIRSSNFGVPGDRRTHNKTPRGARNVALRQFLEPALEAAVEQRNQSSSDPWPSLTPSKDLDDESQVKSVWS